MKKHTAQSMPFPEKKAGAPVWINLLPWTIITLMVLVYSDSFPDPENSLRYMLFSIILLLFAVGAFLSGNYHINGVFSRKILFWFLAVAAAALLSVARSAFLWEGLYEWSKLLLQAGGLWMWLIYFPLLKNSESNLLKSMFFALALITAVALLQLLPYLQSTLGAKELHSMPNALHSTFSNKNFLGESLVLMLPIFCIGLLNKTRIIRVSSVFAVVLIIVLLMFIHSLSTIVALTVTVPAVVILFLLTNVNHKIKFNGKAGRLMLAAVALILIAGTIGWKTGGLSPYSKKVHHLYQYIFHSENTEENFSPKNDNSVYERLLLVKNSGKMIAENPLTGVGISDFKLLFPKYGISGSHFLNSGRMRYEHPHNEYLFIWIECGLPGILTWMGFLFFILWTIYKFISRTQTEHNVRIKLLLLSGGILSFMILSLFSYPRERYFSFILLQMMVGYCGFLITKPEDAPSSYGKKIAFLFLPLLGLSVWLHASHIRSEFYFKRAQQCQFQKKFPEMLTFLNKASSRFTLDQTATPFSWYKGMAHYHSRDTVNAFLFYKKATEENPYHLQAWNDLAAIQEKRGFVNEALIAVTNALEINPYFPDALFNASLIQLKSGRPDSALYYLDQFPYPDGKSFRFLSNAILAEVIGRQLNSTQDTALMLSLNDTILTDWHLLTRIYLESEKDTVLMFNKLENFRR